MTHASATGAGYKLYLRVWIVLLILTLVMIFLDQAPLSFGLLSVVLVATMLVKASLIAAYFMHLRFEGIFLRLSLILGFLFFGAVLYLLIVPDGFRILDMVKAGG